LGAPTAPLRILILAGQHGDEEIASQAVRQFATHAADQVASLPVQVGLLPLLNPDGQARSIRGNARGVDLNRDHQLLTSREVQVLHHFIRTWQPHIVVDVHTYPSRRRHLLRRNLVYCHDVFLDVPTNPGVAGYPWAHVRKQFLQASIKAVSAQGYRCNRYTLIQRSGHVRHSTPNPMDARNGLALRYGLFTVLVEGREPVQQNSSQESLHVLNAMQASFTQIIGWAHQHSELLRQAWSVATPGEIVAVRARYLRSARSYRMAFADRKVSKIRQVRLPGAYTPRLRVQKEVALPTAYAVPRTHRWVLQLLHSHGFASFRGETTPLAAIERYWIQALDHAHPSDKIVRENAVQVQQASCTLEDYVIFPVTQVGGCALAILLEPESQYGFACLPQSGLEVNPTSFYPILRIVG